MNDMNSKQQLTPFTTGIGIDLEDQLTKPVTLRTNTTAATVIPAAMFSWMEYLRAMAMAAMAFIGCTGKGIPKRTPVAMFAMPVNTSVLESEIECVKVSAIMRGRRVPRSPRLPDNSERGCDRRFCTLRECILWRPSRDNDMFV